MFKQIKNIINMFKKVKEGFTLIELLVVIAIIAILAAILFPVFAQAREKARQASCLSNTKQIGTALQLYVDDYEEMFPLMVYNATGLSINDGYPSTKFTTADTKYTGWAKWQTWMDAIFPYVKNVNIFVCPSGNKNYAGYSYNVQLIGGLDHYLQNTAIPISLSEIVNPSQTIFVTDGAQRTDKGGTYLQIIPSLFYDWPKAVCRHISGSNWTFSDGHAKYYKSGQGPSSVGWSSWKPEGWAWWDPKAN